MTITKESCHLPMDEFSFIEKYLTPLTFGKAEALSLKDDAAIIPQKPGYDIVISKDAIVEGTHFFKNDSLYDIARKLVRVNISDLAAKGATPYCCFLALILPQNSSEQWFQQFTNGLKDDLQEFGCFLAGGDTTVHNGGLVLTLTVLGYVPTGKTILRSGANDGDLVFVTGTIGDSYLGLETLRGNYKDLSQEAKKFVQGRYFIPEPRISVGQELLNIASSATDVSDGLLADLENICNSSGVGAEIILDKIPFSPAAVEASNTDNGFFIKAITGGDDYELLFTAPASMQNKIDEISQNTGIEISNIGKIMPSGGVKLLTENGKEVWIERLGYRHRV